MGNVVTKMFYHFFLPEEETSGRGNICLNGVNASVTMSQRLMSYNKL